MDHLFQQHLDRFGAGKHIDGIPGRNCDIDLRDIIPDSGRVSSRADKWSWSVARYKEWIWLVWKPFQPSFSI